MSDVNVVQFRAPGRSLPSFVDGFVEYTEGIQSPELFRRWAGITAVAAALEQKVWIRSQSMVMYPNLYVFLVGPSGAGKSNALHELEDVWDQIQYIPAEREGPVKAPISLTKPALMDALAESFRVDQSAGWKFNSLFVAVGELGALLPGYDADFLNALTYIYDCRPYSEKRRSKEHELIIAKPQINLLACCTPSFLVSLMPQSAWEQGFLARVHIIYSDKSDLVPLKLEQEEKSRNETLRKSLIHDMLEISKVHRQLKFDRAASDMIEAWHMARKSHEPTHPRLHNYNTRRTAHLLKLSMIAAMDHSNTESISVFDVRKAQNWIAESEGHMENIFKAMVSGGDAQVARELQHWIAAAVARNKDVGLPSHQIRGWLAARAPANSHDNILSMMLRSRMIYTKLESGVELYYAGIIDISA